jgi:hypothetical protein
MADQTLTFDAHPVAQNDQLVFAEVTLGVGETTIEVDCQGKVRLCAIAHPAGAEGTTVTVEQVVPFTAGDALLDISGLSVTVAAGEVTTLPFASWFWQDKFVLTFDAAQSGAAAVIGFYAWRGQVE